MAYMTPEQRMDQKIRNAEMSKAVMFPVTGKHNTEQFINTAMIDEEYMVVGSHVDNSTVQKIKNGEYVDFGKLIPRDRILTEEDNRLELVIKGGHTYYVPASESTEINNFARWEQAFWVYSNLYTRFFPH